MTELNELLKTFDKLDKTLTTARISLFEAKEAPVESSIIFPDPQNLKSFYSDFILFKTAVMNVNKDILTLQTHSQKIDISMLALLELLSDKFKIPVFGLPDQKLKEKPPFVANIDDILKEKMSWIFAEFNRIMAVGDPRINRLCQDYFRVQSYPLIVRLNYLDWERQFIAYHIKQTETRLEDKKTQELREIRKQYTDRIDKEKSALNLRLSHMQSDIQHTRTVNDRLDGLYLDTQNENLVLKQEIEALHEKAKGTEENNTRHTEENTALKVEVELLKAKLSKYESNEWKQDFASTNTTPVFCNMKDNKFIKFPCTLDDFKRDYTLTSSDGENREYTHKDGKKFQIPDSLALKLPTLISQIQQQSGNGVTPGAPKLASDEILVGGKPTQVSNGAKAIYDCINNNNNEPMSTGELIEKTLFSKSNVSKGLAQLRKLGVLDEEENGGMKIYSLNNQDGE